MKQALDLDTLDRELLALLSTNARESAAHLARRLKVARTTVLARIARLEKSGVVAGYGVRFGAAVREQGLAAYVGIAVEPRAGPQVLRALERLPEVEHVAAVSGQTDYMATVRCASAAHLDRVLDAIGALDGVKETVSAIILATKIDRRAA